MKKRCVDISRLRKMKRMKIPEKISESAYTFLRFMVLWTVVLLADFILEFRLEYLWPCWLFLGSVYTTFHCHGLIICVVFVCAAFTLDIFCLIFVPLHWLFFAASTYVLFNYIWHTEKGICVSTLTLWVLLVYAEASVRMRELKTSHTNLSHLFAAHCIGYPVVYMGLDVTCYFTSVFKLRSQKAIQNENSFHLHLLQQSLPPDMTLYPKLVPENSKWRSKPESSQYQCAHDAAVWEERRSPGECHQIHRPQARTERDVEEAKPKDPNPHPPAARRQGSELPAGSPVTPKTPENTLKEDQGGKTQRQSKSSPPKVQKTLTNVSTGKGEKKPKAPKPVSTTTDFDRSSTGQLSPPNPHAEQMSKLEQELRRLKGELQVSRQSEQELRSHVCNLTNSQSSLRPEVSLLRHANQLLQSKILCLTKSRQKDKQATAILEKKTRLETETRAAVEKQIIEIRAHKLDESAILLHDAPNRQEQSETQALKKKAKDLETEYEQLQLDYQGREARVLALESEVEALQKHRCMGQEAEALLSALSALQDKAQHLEYNLSAETRLKLDLFSALGDARRQLELAQVRVAKQDREIAEMKQKIAEVMAVTPGMSYVTPRTSVPQYLKFLNSERYMLSPRALMYQCLKK
ncbi:macoilin [Chanos chanos]|uniref:Macoilin n=1 Tax=Chanos chanos TaxID=29144 RepID=A0A6J2W4Q6_CHACN|nr:macoilin-like [Chanos chanos]